MFVVGATVFRVNEPIVVENTSDFGFNTHEFFTTEDATSTLLTNSVFSGGTFSYSYETPGQKILSLYAKKTDGSILLHTANKSVTFSIGYYPSATLAYELRSDQIAEELKNYIEYGITFEFIRSSVGPEDSFEKTYDWYYDGGICGSASGATLQKLMYLSYGEKTVGLTVDSMFGITFVSIDFYSVGTPIVGITSSSPFGVINDNTSMTLSAFIIAANGHEAGDIDYTWNVFGQSYSGISLTTTARFGDPNSNVTLNYFSKILSGLSGTTTQSYTVQQISNPIVGFPLYVEYTQMIGFTDSQYGVNLGYSSASDYEQRLLATNCINCKWRSDFTYQRAIDWFDSLPDNQKTCINLNIEYPWMNILYSKYNGDPVQFKNAIAKPDGVTIFPVKIEWERMYGAGLSDPLAGVEPITGQNWYNVDSVGIKNAATKVWLDIVDYMKANGAERVIHYVWPSQNVHDGYYGGGMGIPLSGYRGEIYPVGVSHSYWYYKNTGDAYFTGAVNPFLYNFVFGNLKTYPRANSNTDSYGMSSYNYFPNISIPGITRWQSTYGYNLRKKVGGAGETYQYELEDLKYWTKVSHGNLVQRSRDVLYNYGVTHANISVVVWPNLQVPGDNANTAWNKNHWGEHNSGSTFVADIIVDGFFGDRDIDSMELFDPYCRPDSIVVWDVSSWFYHQFLGSRSTSCPFPECSASCGVQNASVNIGRSILEKVLFGRDLVGVSGVSGTIGDEPIGSDNINLHRTWFSNNNIGATYWANENWSTTQQCNVLLNETIWWTPAGGSQLPNSCSIGPNSPLAPWLDFSKIITTQDIRRALRHWITNRSIGFIERLRYKLDLAKPKKIIPMYGDWKLFVGWNSTELANPSVAAIVEPYKQRLQKILTPYSYIGVATFGDMQTKLNLLSTEDRKNLLLDIKYPWVGIAYEAITGPTGPYMIGTYYDRLRSEWQRQKGSLTGFAGATIGALKEITAKLMSDCIAWGYTNGSENMAAYQRAVGLNGVSGYGTEERGAGIPFAGLRGNTFAPAGISHYIGPIGSSGYIGYTSEYSYWKSRTNSTDENMTVAEYVNLELAQKRYDVFIRGLSAAGRWMIPVYNLFPNVGNPQTVAKWRTLYPVERISPDGIVQENAFDLDDLNYWAEKNMAKVVTEFRRGLIQAGATSGIPKVAPLLYLSGSGFNLSANGHEPEGSLPETYLKLNHWAFLKDIQKAAVMEIRGLFSHCDINFPYFTYPDEVWFWDLVSYFCVTLPTLNLEALDKATFSGYNTALQCAVARNSIEKKLFNRPYPQEGEPIGYTFDQYFGATLGITLHNDWFFNNNIGTTFWKIPAYAGELGSIGLSGTTWWDLQTGSLLPTPCSIDPIDGPLSPWLPQGTTLNTSHIHFALKHYLSEEYCSALEKAKATMDEMLGNR